MLGLLMKYAEDNGLQAEPGFKPKDVRWAILCDEDGRFLDIVELGDVRDPKNRGRTFARCPDLSQPELIKGGVTRSHFLVDAAQVVVGYDRKAEEAAFKAGKEKARAKHAYFLRLLKDAAISVPELEKITQCLSNEETLQEIRVRMNALKIKNEDKVTFRVGSSYPVDSDRWHDWWRQYRSQLAKGKVAGETAGPASGKRRSPIQELGECSVLMRCFATGEVTEPAPTHPKIEGLADVGGIASGDTLIGFDKDAFCSYGLEQSANAAVSEKSAAAYRLALNHLLRNHAERLGDTKVVHWFKTKVSREDDPLYFLHASPELEELGAQDLAKRLLSSIRTGKRTDLLNNYFYALTISGAAGRIMVRDWMEGQFEKLAANIALWFEDLSIVRREGQGLAPGPKFMAVLGATVRELKDLAPPFVSKMWRVAVTGEPIPHVALSQALVRYRWDLIEDQAFNHARMGLMKAYHVRNKRLTGGNTMDEDLRPYLNENHPHPAYQCGRLMAVLAALQRSALGDVGAGVVQRYYAAASATPALVLGRLARLSQFHLNKLEGGLARWYEDKIAAILSKIRDSIPRTLTLEDQSLFALGYYQQMADMRKKSRDTDREEGKIS